MLPFYQLQLNFATEQHFPISYNLKIALSPLIRMSALPMMSDELSFENCFAAISWLLDSDPNGFKHLPRSISAQLFIIHSGNFDVNIDAIQQRTRDLFLIFGHHRRHTSTRLERVTIESAQARIHTIRHIFYVKQTVERLFWRLFLAIELSTLFSALFFPSSTYTNSLNHLPQCHCQLNIRDTARNHERTR